MRRALWIFLALLLLVACPWIGSRPPGEAGDFILWQLRVPRTLMAALVGATLSLVGAVYQTVLGNPLAAPSTVGTTAGAALGALVAIVFGLSASVGGLPIVAVAAFVGALAVTFLLTALAANDRARVDDVLLMGVAIALAAGAISAGLQFTSDQIGLAKAVRWTLGHLPQVGYRGVLLIAPFTIVSAGLLLSQTRALEALVGGEDLAHAQGVNVTRVRTLTLGAGALGVSAVVAWCGPIAFVGLLVPHLTRKLFGTSRRVLLPASLILGAVFLALCDTLSRTLVPGREIPVGVFTAALGAPTLIWLVTRRT